MNCTCSKGIRICQQSMIEFGHKKSGIELSCDRSKKRRMAINIKRSTLCSLCDNSWKQRRVSEADCFGIFHEDRGSFKTHSTTEPQGQDRFGLEQDRSSWRN